MEVVREMLSKVPLYLEEGEILISDRMVMMKWLYSLKVTYSQVLWTSVYHIFSAAHTKK